jgi:hypothetical protein
VYYSHDWARKNVHQDEDTIEEMNKECDEEADDPRYHNQ